MRTVITLDVNLWDYLSPVLAFPLENPNDSLKISSTALHGTLIPFDSHSALVPLGGKKACTCVMNLLLVQRKQHNRIPLGALLLLFTSFHCHLFFFTLAGNVNIICEKIIRFIQSNLPLSSSCVWVQFKRQTVKRNASAV